MQVSPLRMPINVRGYLQGSENGRVVTIVELLALNFRCQCTQQKRCHRNSVNTRSLLPICSDVKTRKRWNVIGIDMIRNNRIAPKWVQCLRVPALELSTLGCSSTHNNTLQDFTENSIGARYLLSLVLYFYVKQRTSIYVQVHIVYTFW